MIACYVYSKNSKKTCNLPNWATESDFENKTPIISCDDLDYQGNVDNYCEVESKKDNQTYYLHCQDFQKAFKKIGPNQEIILIGHYLVKVNSQKVMLVPILDFEEYKLQHTTFTSEFEKELKLKKMKNDKEKKIEDSKLNLEWGTATIDKTLPDITEGTDGEIYLKAYYYRVYADLWWNYDQQIISKHLLKALKGKIHVVKFEDNELVFMKRNLQQYTIRLGNSEIYRHTLKDIIKIK